MLKKAVKTLLLLLVIVFVLALLVETRLAIAPFLITFIIGLAIAGPARWLAWTAVFVVASAFASVVLYFLTKLSSNGVLAGVVVFGLLPLIPAFQLWLACLLRRRSD